MSWFRRKSNNKMPRESYHDYMLRMYRETENIIDDVPPVKKDKPLTFDDVMKKLEMIEQKLDILLDKK